MPKETKDTPLLEDVLREKFSTGYDPIKISVKNRALNHENVEVFIEGIPYSVVGNEVRFTGKKSSISTLVEEGAEKGLLQKSQESVNTTPPEPTPAPVGEPVQGQPALDTNAGGSPSSAPSKSADTANAGSAVKSFEARVNDIVKGFNGKRIEALNENTAKEYGDIVYTVIAGDDEKEGVVAQGTLEQLEGYLLSAQQNQAAAQSQA